MENTLDEVFEEMDYNNYPNALYALYVKRNLPDIGEVTDVVGISHCTVIISAKQGILGDYPEWLDKFDEEEIKAVFITHC